jgi:Protein of unknown function (DUF998)
MTLQAVNESSSRKVARELLLGCGILSSLLYVGTDIAAALRWEGYSYTAQAVSELMAVEAPTRAFIVPLFLAYGVLVMAFGVDLLLFAGTRRAFGAAGGMLIAYGAVGMVALLVFPMHLRGAAPSMTMTDRMHLILTGLSVLAIFLFIACGAAARGKRFRIYSLGTLLLLIGFGAWAGLDAPRVAAQLPTPWLGVKERVSIYATLLWVLALAIALLREGSAAAAKSSAGGGPDTAGARPFPAQRGPAVPPQPSHA